MNHSYFITSSGTDMGKTFVACHLIRQLCAKGMTVTARKPVISGYDPADAATSDTWRLIDALGETPSDAMIETVSPWRFRAPLSPHMAAAQEGQSLSVDAIVTASQAAHASDLLLVEGVGGVMVPLNDEALVIDWIAALGWPSIVVVGNYLGSISHSLSAIEALERRNLPIAGVVVSESPDATVDLEATAATLRQFTDNRFPILTLPRQAEGASIDAIADLTVMVA